MQIAECYNCDISVRRRINRTNRGIDFTEIVFVERLARIPKEEVCQIKLQRHG